MQPDDFAPGRSGWSAPAPVIPDLLTMKAVRVDRVRRHRLSRRACRSRHAEPSSCRDRDGSSVGKRSGRHFKDQRTIDALLVEAAARGKRVVRLKGGDPSIFGRSARRAWCASRSWISGPHLPRHHDRAARRRLGWNIAHASRHRPRCSLRHRAQPAWCGARCRLAFARRRWIDLGVLHGTRGRGRDHARPHACGDGRRHVRHDCVSCQRARRTASDNSPRPARTGDPIIRR